MTTKYVTAHGQRYRVGSQVRSRYSGLVWVVDGTTRDASRPGNILLVHLPETGLGNTLRPEQVEVVR